MIGLQESWDELRHGPPEWGKKTGEQRIEGGNTTEQPVFTFIQSESSHNAWLKEIQKYCKPHQYPTRTNQ
ncbi:hypothetical protein VP01_952g10 [Puccinia sorghi]|uniref:Uncharacterized protein n=1 Tax=Puccinia sorghi TaxID=27349 RepID=A0A0L6U6C6_9BASI|nr:hypothetical protein VP01_952g10 [Puccinia sorghi]